MVEVLTRTTRQHDSTAVVVQPFMARSLDHHSADDEPAQGQHLSALNVSLRVHLTRSGIIVQDASPSPSKSAPESPKGGQNVKRSRAPAKSSRKGGKSEDEASRDSPSQSFSERCAKSIRSCGQLSEGRGLSNGSASAGLSGSSRTWRRSHIRRVQQGLRPWRCGHRPNVPQSLSSGCRRSHWL